MSKIIIPHTPRPWYILASLPPRTWRFVGSDGAIICTLPDGEQQQGNALLISAAPDFIDAARRFTNWYERRSLPELQGVACDFFQAIAKAEGREA